ncbi:hypothetical protein RHDC4_01887 [Rhodocyclaceae bacterium]|nr:hypothetical protein RHDC4_01887 [Rhodocyclaceae bacterium]
MKIVAAFLGLGLLALSASSHAFKLINDEEAALPAAATMTTRGITRGPGIKLLSPDPAAAAVKAPFNLKVAFEPRGGAKIDPASVKVSYLKATPVDLLERVRPGLSEAGIELAGAEVPPGEHQIQVSVQDSEGRKASTVIRLTVAK